MTFCHIAWHASINQIYNPQWTILWQGPVIITETISTKTCKYTKSFIVISVKKCTWSHHWFRWWLADCQAQSHYLKWLWHAINKNKRNIFQLSCSIIQKFSCTKCFKKCIQQNDVHFVFISKCWRRPHQYPPGSPILWLPIPHPWLNGHQSTDGCLLGSCGEVRFYILVVVAKQISNTANQ